MDTDSKTCKKMVNGVEMDFDEMSISECSYNPPVYSDSDEDSESKKVTEYSVRVTMNNGDSQSTQSYNWTKENEKVYNVEYSKTSTANKSFAPNSGMKSEAKKGLEWRKEHKRGGTQVGVARARDISNGKDLSYDTVKRMRSFFARHEQNKSAEGFRPGEKGYPSNGRIAWALWGGDAGKSWADKIVKREEKKDKK